MMTENGSVFVAFYKGKKQGNRPRDLLVRFSDWATRKLTKGAYSHCEIAVAKNISITPESNGNVMPLVLRTATLYECYSASIRDGGVRKKIISLTDGKWDLVPLKAITEAEVQAYFAQTKGAKYDWLGAFGVVFRTRQSQRKFFCSEWCSQFVNGGFEGWRFSPNDLFAMLRGK